ncbi:GntR family transcriptional regulator [Rhodobium gokarnense]|uniref:DNA-binding GntR family transcriptional regulator n=1 Tax=Rhodobium gokarnense TaxID=364296 RepID=A0ABT3H8M1_9HYPH|nr:GntR family transcriptional regulator [Rhodobium gokarnense]MCW2306698.1 DNA-binding GntR family transcriptional regulator [Rhodobium gokarnense]
MSLAEMLLNMGDGSESFADSRLPLPDRIAGYIRHQIIHDLMKPGEPIRERAIAEQLKVSRTPMRDALKLLSVEGLVDLIPNRGAVVVDNSLDDITDMLSVYCELDVLGGEAACRKGSETDFLKIERYQEIMEEAAAEQNRLKYFHANQAFHLAIIAASRNRTLIEIHSNLSLRLHRVRYLSILAQQKWLSRADEHHALIKALRARDTVQMAALQRAHFAVAWRLVDDWSRSAGQPAGKR